MATLVELMHLYFGKEGDPNVTGATCNACAIDISHWAGRMERHIEFHEGLKTLAAPPTEAMWTMTETEFNRELAGAWHRGQRAAIAWHHRSDKGEGPSDPICPYGKPGSMEWCGE